MKTCPDCAESVKAAANVCRYCGHRFNEIRDPKPRIRTSTVCYLVLVAAAIVAEAIYAAGDMTDLQGNAVAALIVVSIPFAAYRHYTRGKYDS